MKSIAVITIIWILLVFWIILWKRIFEKAGYRPSFLMGLTMAIPIVNLILLIIFAFFDWPLENKHKNPAHDHSILPKSLKSR